MLKIRNRKSLVAYLAAYFVPIIIFLAAFLMLPIFKIPRSILLHDPNMQYVDFLSYFKRVLMGEESIFYSFNLSSGASLMAAIPYYLISPLNLLVLLVPNYNICYVFFAIVVIKIGFIGLASYYYFRKEHKKLGVWRPLIFAWGLALSAYLLGYFEHFEWLGSIALLPIVCLGINKIARGQKPWLYIVALTATIASCYYTGFMICIFSVIWLIYRVSIEKNSREKTKKSVASFIGASLLAGLLSGILLIPAGIAMIGGNTGRLDISLFTPGSRFALKQLFLQITSNQIYYRPLLFGGMIVTVFLLFYFANKNISIREKVASSAVLAFLIISINVKGLCAIWHLGTLERGAPYRFTFIIIFFIATIAARALEECAAYKGRKAISFIALGFSIVYLLMLPDAIDAIHNMMLYLDLSIIAVTTVALLRGSKNTGRVVLGAQLLSVAMFTLSMLVMIGRWEWSLSPFTNTAKNIKEITEIVNLVKEQDDSAEFYRIEKTFVRSRNDGLQAGYHGVSSYISTTNDTIADPVAMTNYAYDTANYGSLIEGDMMPNIVASAIGAKYIITTNDNYMDEEHYIKVAQTEKYSAYKYDSPLPVAMVLDEEFVNKENIFDYRNENKTSEWILGKKIYNNVKAEVSLENLVEQDGVYRKIVGSRDGVIVYKIKNPTGETVFAKIQMDVVGHHVIDDTEVLLKEPDGTYEHLNNLGQGSMLNLGEDQEIELKIKLFHDETELKERVFFHEDKSVVEELVDTIKSQKSEWIEVSNTELEGKVVVKKPNQALLFSFEYDKGWQITVDGARVEPRRVMSGVFAIDITEGEHEVKLKYVPRGLRAGITTSAIGVATAVVWYLVDRKKSKK